MSHTLEEHLGGHGNKTWTDRGALEFLAAEVGAKTYLDIGCGPGGQLEIATHLGLKGLGIDGDHTLEYNSDLTVQIHDFSSGPLDKDDMIYVPKSGYFDIGWTVEFLEHVDEEFIPNFMKPLTLCKYVVMTHAIPGLGGHHHVNERHFDYWESVFKEYGFSADIGLTRAVRGNSTMKNKRKLSSIPMPKNYLSDEFNHKKTSFLKRHGWVFANDRLTGKEPVGD